MKNLSSHIIPFCLIIASFVFTGCIDEPVAPEGNVVQGQIYDGYGSAYSTLQGSVFISAGEYPIVPLGNDGEFTIDVISKPYDIVTALFEPFVSPFVLKFKGISQNNIKIVFDNPFNPYPTNFIQAYIPINFPPLKEDKIIYLKFISENIFFQRFSHSHGQTGDTIGSMELGIPYGSREISGRLYYLEVDRNGINGEIYSYDKFGIKNVTFDFYNLHSVRFTEQELQQNISTVESNINVVPLNVSAYYNARINISFPPLNKTSDLEILGIDNFTNAKIKLPVLSANDFKIKVSSFYTTSVFPRSTGEKWIYVNPGENATINHAEPIKLLLPLNNAENVTGTTTFEILDNNNESGIYIYTLFKISENSKRLKFFTSHKNLKFSDFITRGFEYTPNQLYRWDVKKYPKYASMDEFVSIIYTIDNKYDYTQVSEGFHFKTLP